VYHSEHGQDRWLEEHVFKGKRDGIFVEFGALDGLETSNTLFFERERGWDGLLIEANPRSFCGLLNSDRRARKVLAAVGAGYGVAEFTAVAHTSGWSGLSGQIDPRHRARIGETAVEAFHVATLPLAAILKHFGLFEIDYLSIDVEGAEVALLAPFLPDFDYFDIDVLDVENNYGEPVVETLMMAAGYRKIAMLGINDIYRRTRSEVHPITLP
jgi:FkbM family methyltransferase